VGGSGDADASDGWSIHLSTVSSSSPAGSGGRRPGGFNHARMDSWRRGGGGEAHGGIQVTAIRAKVQRLQGWGGSSRVAHGWWEKPRPHGKWSSTRLSGGCPMVCTERFSASGCPKVIFSAAAVARLCAPSRSCAGYIRKVDQLQRDEVEVRQSCGSSSKEGSERSTLEQKKFGGATKVCREGGKLLPPHQRSSSLHRSHADRCATSSMRRLVCARGGNACVNAALRRRWVREAGRATAVRQLEGAQTRRQAQRIQRLVEDPSLCIKKNAARSANPATAVPRATHRILLRRSMTAQLRGRQSCERVHHRSGTQQRTPDRHRDWGVAVRRRNRNNEGGSCR
jgi:hypothetical protein